MVNEVRASLPKPEPFNWEREYGPLWTGSDCSAFWLAPEPGDVLEINGVRATLRDHETGAARWLCACGETNPHYMWNRNLCFACDAGYRRGTQARMDALFGYSQKRGLFDLLAGVPLVRRH